MEFQSSFSVLILSIFVLLMIKRFTTQKKLPPGPWKLPIIGSLHHLTGSLPHRRLRDLAVEYGPLFHLQMGQLSAVVVSSPAAAKEALLKNKSTAFADRMVTYAGDFMIYNKADLIFAPYGDYWKYLRRICSTELLSNKNFRSFSSLRENEYWGLISAIESSSGSKINLSKMMTDATSAVTCKATFGNNMKDLEAVISVLEEVLTLSSGFHVVDLFPSLNLQRLTGIQAKLERMKRRLDEILEEIIHEHGENRSTRNMTEGREEDIVDALLRIKESGNGLDFPVTKETIKGLVFDLFSAGTGTTSSTVEWAMSEMVQEPETMRKAQDEVRSVLRGKTRVHETDIQGLNFLKLVIKETLRLHPPAALISRECIEECELAGYKIPVATKLIVNAWAIGRDPEAWKDAETFEPERFRDSAIEFTGNHFEYIPFGAGKRICPGLSFGLANVELALAQLLYHFDWKLPDGMNPGDLDMDEEFGIAVRRKTHLHLVATSYSPSPQ